MEILDSIILGVLQGITEFLPVSSSGHLILGEHYLGLKVEVLKSFDIAVHVGTLLAILVYFRRDLWGLMKAFFTFNFRSDYGRLIGFILIGTVPAGLAGIFLEDWIDGLFRNATSVGMWMMIMGVVFIAGEAVYKSFHKGVKQEVLEKVDSAREVLDSEYVSEEVRGMTWKKALVIGLAQAVALIPGVSRSGSTIVAGLFQGVKRSAAARFSFLLGIPVMAGAGLLTSLKTDASSVEMWPMVVGLVVSFIFGMGAVAFLMRFLKNHSLKIFAVYLIAVGFGVFI